MWKCEIPKNRKYLEEIQEQLAEYNEKVKQLDNEQEAKQTQEQAEKKIATIHEF